MCSDWSNLSCRIFREAYFILGKNYLWVLWLYPWICAAPCLACKMTHLQNSVLHGDHLAPSVMVRYKLVAHWTGDQLILLLATDFRSCAMHLCYSFYCLTWKGGEFFCELPSELQLVPQGIVSDAKCERYQKKKLCGICSYFVPLATQLGTWTWQSPAPTLGLCRSCNCNKLPSCIDRVETAYYC